MLMLKDFVEGFYHTVFNPTKSNFLATFISQLKYIKSNRNNICVGRISRAICNFVHNQQICVTVLTYNPNKKQLNLKKCRLIKHFRKIRKCWTVFSCENPSDLMKQENNKKQNYNKVSQSYPVNLHKDITKGGWGG